MYTLFFVINNFYKQSFHLRPVVLTKLRAVFTFKRLTPNNKQYMIIVSKTLLVVS